MLSSFLVIFFGWETEVQHGRGWQIRQGKNSVGDGGNCLSDLGWEKAGIFLTSPKPRRPKGNVRERICHLGSTVYTPRYRFFEEPLSCLL